MLKMPLPTLAKITDELQKEIAPLRYRPFRSSKRWSQKKACLGLVIGNYGEVLIILKRLVVSQERLRQLHSDIVTAAFASSTDPDAQADKGEKLTEYMALMEPITLDIKTLYVWCYHIKEAFRNCGVQINAMPELQRISLLRSAFITHVADQPMFQTASNFQAGMVFDAKCEAIRIRFHPLIVKGTQFIGLKSLVRSARRHIPELRTEENYYEQMRLLYENLGKLLNTDLHKKAEQLIRKIGTVSEPPAQVGSILLKAFREYKRLKRI